METLIGRASLQAVCVGVAALAWIFPCAILAEPASMLVGPNVQVSKTYRALFHGETLIDADPVDPKHLIACSTVWENVSDYSMEVAAYLTFDGGATWNATKRMAGGDPACGIGFDGHAYLGSYGLVPTHSWYPFNQSTDRFTSSRDGGRTWAKPFSFEWGDRDFITVDTTQSRYRGRVYFTAAAGVMQGMHMRESFLAERYTADNGATFSPRIHMHTDSRKPGAKGLSSAPGTVLSNGTFVTLGFEWPEVAAPTSIVALVSTDGGNTFSDPRPVAQRINSALPENRQIGFSIIPRIAADRSSGPFRGRTYVVWQDFRNGPAANIVLVSSADAGKTWTDPIVVDDAPPASTRANPQVFAPAVAVNENGIVAVMWYDGRNLADGMGGALRMAVSNDGGESFSRSAAVATGASVVFPHVTRLSLGDFGGAFGNARLGIFGRYHVYGGDTDGLVADAAGNFHPLWVDNRTGVAQVWTARVAVNGRALRRGSTLLAPLHDVTNDVIMRLSNAAYDRRTHLVTADLALLNASKYAIRGAIRLRILRLSSVLGVPQLLDADNGQTDSGAVLTFAPSSGDTIKPFGGLSQKRRLTFRLTDTHELVAADITGESADLITFTYRAYIR